MGFENTAVAQAGAVGPETIDEILNHCSGLADQVATASHRIANAVAGTNPPAAGSNPVTPVESSVIARLKEIRRILQVAEADSYRAKTALGLQ